MLVLVISFALDYPKIQFKINKDSIFKIAELQHEYDINKCIEKGHLQALKTQCENILNQISILRNVKTS
jgi:hypothetical protein